MSEKIPHDTKGADPTVDMHEKESKELKAEDYAVFLIKGSKYDAAKDMVKEEVRPPPSPESEG